MQPQSKDRCSLFGCTRPRKSGARVDIVIGGNPEVVWPCEEHENFFVVTDPALYILGYTFLGEVQLRLLKTHPATPE